MPDTIKLDLSLPSNTKSESKLDLSLPSDLSTLTQPQSATVQVDPKQKIREAVASDRKRTAGFMDIMLPDYIATGINTAKAVGSAFNGFVGGMESLLRFGMESAAETIIPASVQVTSLIKGGGIQPIKPVERKAVSELKKGISTQLDVIKPSLKLEGKFDLSNGFGIEDIKSLPEIIGRMGFDIPAGTLSGGSTYFMQGYGDAVDEYDKAVEKGHHGYDEKSRAFYGIANGAINSVLETYAVDKIFTGPAFSKIKSKILADVFKETAQLEGKISISAVERLVKDRTTDALNTIKTKGIKTLYSGAVEGGTEGLQTGLGDLSKLATNAIQGKEIFDEKEVKDNLVWNIINSAAAGSLTGLPMGAVATFTQNTDNHILDEIAKAKTPEEANIVIDNLNIVLDEQNASQEEKDLVIKRAQRYAEIKRSIPAKTPYQVQNQAIKLIDQRTALDTHIQEAENQLSGLDEALVPDAQESLSVFKDAKNSINDKIKDLVTGSKTTYYKTDENYYRKVEGKSPERINQNRFDLEQIHLEENPPKPTSEQQLSPEAKQIEDNRNKELSALPPLRIDMTNEEYQDSMSKSEEINLRYNRQLAALPTTQTTTDATTTSNIPIQEGGTESNLGEYQGTESEQAPQTNEADSSNRPISGETQQVMIGDTVQWSPNGNPEFDTPRIITSLNLQEGTVIVDGIDNSIPMTELTVVNPVITSDVSIPTKGISNRFILFLKKNINPFGVLGRTVVGLKENLAGSISAEIKKGEVFANRVIKLAYKYKGLISESDIDAYLTGSANRNPIPLDLASALADLRAHIDKLTDAMISTGVITDPKEIAKYKENKGSYLTRSYALFDTKNVHIGNVIDKLKNVDQTVLDNALSYLSKAIKKSNEAAGNIISDEEALRLAKIEANNILTDQPNAFTTKKIEGSLNVKSLTERQDIDAPIRALMGEYTDPVQKYYVTVFKMATLISSQKYMTDLRTIGLGKVLFKKNDPNFPTTPMIQIAASGSDAMAPLNGLYTFPEYREALSEQAKQTTHLIWKIAGIVRGFKTIYNPPTHLINITGNLGFFVANGHWNEAATSFELIKELITGKDTEKLNDFIFKLNSFGVLNNTVGIGELKAYFDNHASMNDLLDNVHNDKNFNIKNISKGIVKASKKVSKSIEDAYQMEDDIFKIIAYVNESNRRSKALFNERYNDLDDTNKHIVDEVVSEIVKNTFPTWSRVPAGVKNLSRYLLLGNFISFPAEVVRVSYETLKLATNELKSNNPKIRHIGATRLAPCTLR